MPLVIVMLDCREILVILEQGKRFYVEHPKGYYILIASAIWH
jgi:hypothetical protein